MVISIGMSRAAKFGGRAQAAPAAFAIGLVGFLESLGRAHHAILEMAAFLVARLVEGLQHFLAELAGIGQDVVDQVGRQVLELRQVAMLFDLQEFVDQEADNPRPARDRWACGNPLVMLFLTPGPVNRKAAGG